MNLKSSNRTTAMAIALLLGAMEPSTIPQPRKLIKPTRSPAEIARRKKPSKPPSVARRAARAGHKVAE